MRAFEGYLRKKFDEEATITLSEVLSIESFWRYHNESFMPATLLEEILEFDFPVAKVR